MGVGAERSRLYFIYWQLTMLISGDLGGSVSISRADFRAKNQTCIFYP